MKGVEPRFADGDWMEPIKEESLVGISPTRVSDILNRQQDVALPLTIDEKLDIPENVLMERPSTRG